VMRVKKIERVVKVYEPPKIRNAKQVNDKWLKQANDMKATKDAFKTNRVKI
jgi:hypothetical protein